MMFRPLALALSVVLMMFAAGCRQPAVFRSDVSTAAKPWTHLDFHNDPDAFQFAIVSDRTGGHREGIFESAVDKLNLMQPEFVINVGDAIEGYTEDEAVLNAQWDEYTGFVKRLEMPFFFVPGNHDNINPVMRATYLARFGRTYYSFVYRNVLFLALDSQDADPGLSPAQVAWALATLREQADVRWTVVFMHQPLWLHEEGNVQTERKTIREGRSTGFGEIQKVLAGRPHTVFAGHFHEYVQFNRVGQNYYILSTTGGASELRGPAFGEFDHAVWVTLTPQGPRLANLRLEGILPHNVRTEAHVRFRHGMSLIAEEPFDLAAGARVSLPLANPFGHRLHANLQWTIPEGEPWTVEPAGAEVDIPSGTTNVLSFTLRYAGDRHPPMPPKAELRATAGDELPASPDVLPLAFPADGILRACRPTTTAPRAAEAPALDGRLDDAAWQGAACITDFRKTGMGAPAIATEARLTYDDAALYVAFRSDEPNMEGLRANVTNRDGLVWMDDSVEVMVGPGAGTNAYLHVIANAAGTLYDALGMDRAAIDGQARVAAGRDAGAWTAELAIPWSDLGGRPAAGQAIDLELVRTRTADGVTVQYPPLNGDNHRREMYGRLLLAP